MQRRAGAALLPLAAWPVLAAILPNGLPVGVVGLGVVTGALTSFTALGLVLVYRSSRIVNFAQAEIGGLAASLAVVLVANRGVNYFVAVPLGLAIALLSGVIIELTVVRRFFQAPRLILTVATIGLAQILAAGVVFLPTVLDPEGARRGDLSSTFTTPFDVRREIFPVTFNGNHLVAVVAVVLVLTGLLWLFNRTDAGIGIRGAADSQERAVLLGIPVRRLSLLTWVIAAGLSGLAGILSAGVLGSSAGSVAGPTALLAPLAAAVLARFESLPVAFGSSVLIGIFTQSIFWNYPRATTVDVSLFIIILVSLLLQRRQSVRVAGEDFGSFVGAREVQAMPAALRQMPAIRIARVVGVVVLAATAIGLPFVVSETRVVLFAFVAIYAIVGVSLVVLTGWAGQVSLGQFAFVGLGAATAGSLSANAHLDYVLCLLAAAATGAIVAVLIGIPALRIPGLFLAPVTIAFAVVTSNYFLNPDEFSSFTPQRVRPPILFDRFDLAEPRAFYFVCLAGLVLSMAIAHNLRRTRMGRAILAVRDNERFASAVSIAPVRVKLIAFAVSGALAGFAGGLYVLAIRGIPFGAFSPVLSVQLFTMVVVGGMTSVAGAVVGALYIYFSQYFFSGAAQLLASGAGLLVVLMIAPGGLTEVLYRARDRVVRRLVRDAETLLPAPDAAQLVAPGDAPTAAMAAVAGQSGGALLQCENVTASYGHLQVLFGINLAVQDGAIVGILGTNGAGKTTTLKAITGLVPTTGGQITFDGEDITDVGPIGRVERGIVMVPAKAVFSSLTVRDNLRLGSWVPRHRGDHASVDVSMAQVLALFPRLEERLDQKASLLSGGEQQMLAIAQGLLAGPRLLMIDELSLGLAPTVVAAITEVVRTLNASGLPVIVVEQSINVSATIAGESVFIEKGQVCFAGPTEALAAEESIVAAVFFGSAGNGDKPSPARARPAARRTPASRPIFEATGIEKSYGSVAAVADLDLQIHAGQILGVIGSNGAGKTTAFDIFSGFTEPDAGRLVFNGIDVTRVSAAERASLGFGRTFQDVRLLPSLTVAETLAVSLERHIDVREPLASVLYLGSTARSERRIAARVDELLDAFSLGQYRHIPVSDLSTGTRRVLELACAAGHRASFLLLDEPSSGLSQAESEGLAAVLVDLAAATGATLAIIEHDVPLVSGLADELICMELGRIIARGKPRSVLDDPAVIRSYLGEAEPTHGGDSTSRQSRPLRAEAAS